MAGYKAIGMVFVRRLSRDAGKEQAVRERLSPATRELFDQAVATQWIPIEAITEAFVTAAHVIYPGDVNGLRKVGEELAQDNVHGAYSWLFRFLSVPFIISQTAKLWRMYHQAGEASIAPVDKRQVLLEVRGYPELPERFRECMAGFCLRIIALTGAKDVRVAAGGDAACWTWTIRWA